MTFQQITDDHGTPRSCHASDNKATYILTGANAKDAFCDYQRKFDRYPSSRWYNKHFQFKRIK